MHRGARLVELVDVEWGLIPSPVVRHPGREATLHDKCPSVHVLPEQHKVSSYRNDS